MAILALPLIILAFVILGGLAALFLVVLDNRSTLGRIERKQERDSRRIRKRLASDRQCVLRDVTHGPDEQDSDVPSSDESS